MIVARHVLQGNIVICLTDEDVIGKKFVEGKRQLDLSSSFYQGQPLNKEEVKKVILGAYIIHFSGKQSVALGIELDLIAADHILSFEGVPHAQVILERD